MVPSELAALLVGETSRIEWKQSSDASYLLPAVCALANDLEGCGQPGYLLIGVDKHGHPVGATDDRRQPLLASGQATDEALQKLSSRILSTKLWPHPSIDLSAHAVDAQTVIVITVQPAEVPPEVKVDGVAWVRVGTTTRRASDADLQRLRERRPLARQPFDLRPVPGAGLDDLAMLDLRPRYLIERDEAEDPDSFPSLSRWLVQRGFGHEVQGAFVPNAAALLVYGTSPQRFFPGATIELVHYAESDVDSQVLFRKTIQGTVPEQLEVLKVQLGALNTARPVVSSGIQIGYRDQYPEKALYELARNLVQHRVYEGTHSPARIEWYADHVEFLNPGGPFGRASEGEFGDHSDYRNPTLTQLLVDSHYVERLGRGVRLVRAQLEKNGNPPLKVESNGFTRVLVFASGTRGAA